ncbi:unnamed protein product [Rhizophagus irregularis]|jgi:hypothetical protein|uniref:MATA-HMG n=1 Tax=Rhizophagus irregularis TaxID=588596 RepID=A0A1B1EU37_9GLOM|nr:MATA-HMG [Rhizophagus irregularis]ANQ32319.1 MATA-HMG [Rhizophagus irregularis]PKK69029.1 hypothetical protein RhiirC2_749116 [Rhizophagus irregularis]PKY53151.1 hypothetical protein RhiirA4_408852 [Rhizophagus irregularis]CAB4386999.1 unnamed protein product [Rhizophagus irregularis]
MSDSSLNDMAEILINQLDRRKIFPPSYNNPEELINPSKTSRSKGPPRPPNGFLLCRKNVHKEARLKGICNMRVISKVTGMLWRSASTEEKETYEKLSAQVNNLHSQRYPGYKYRPSARQKTQQPYIVPQTTTNIEIFPTLPIQIMNPQQQPIIYQTNNPLDFAPDFVPNVYQFSQFTQEELASFYYYLSI